MKYIFTVSLPGAVLLLSQTGAANMSYSPWVHEIIQNGNDNEITVQIFGETTWVNGGGEPLPGAEAKYTLTRMSTEGSAEVFKDRQFDPAKAEEVTDFGCQRWELEESSHPDECTDYPEYCEDCDGDGTPECPGFCGKAYRYTVTDHCPPDDNQLMYWMKTDPAYDVVYESEEDLGFTAGAFSGTEQCTDEQHGCTVSGAVGRASRNAWMEIAAVLLGV